MDGSRGFESILLITIKYNILMLLVVVRVVL